MGHQEDYQKRLAEIKAIKDEDIIKTISIPVDTFAQEAEDAYQFCQPDKEALTAIGLNWTEVVEELLEGSGHLGKQNPSGWLNGMP